MGSGNSTCYVPPNLLDVKHLPEASSAPREFIDYWRDRLKGDHTQIIFASINIYNIQRYLRVYWSGGGQVELKGIQEILVRNLLGLIENECPDFKIIKMLNPSCAECLSKDIVILESKKGKLKIKISEDSIKNIDKILELLSRQNKRVF